MALQVVKNETVPIKALPEELLNAVILQEGGLSDWLCKLLSIKPTEENISRIEVLLPLVKENCWSMPIEEIKKAFLAYVQGKLPIEPASNYLDAILFSKVIRAYKQIKPQAKPEPIEIEEDLEIAKQNVMLAFYDWQETGQVSECYAGVFDRFLEWGILPREGENEKADKRYDYLRDAAAVKIRWNLESQIHKEKAKPGAGTPKLFELKQRLSELLAARYNDTEIQNTFRCAVLEGFFKKTTEEELKEKLP